MTERVFVVTFTPPAETPIKFGVFCCGLESTVQNKQETGNMCESGREQETCEEIKRLLAPVGGPEGPGLLFRKQAT